MALTASQLEAQVGHPGDMYKELAARIQDEAIELFGDVQKEWLDLMWTLDAYRVEGVPPRAMGKQPSHPPARLAAVYRGKGNWFANVLGLLLQNQTSQNVAARTKIQGFSQVFQIDLAWPARKVDPIVCGESKVSGAPAYSDTPERSPMADFVNRRKELKFMATDLKLYRRQHKTKIEHWDVWRTSAEPKVYTLWGARMTPKDSVAKLINEAQALINTYLDGVGLFPWALAESGEGYKPVRLPPTARVSTLDDVLHRIATEINQRVGPDGKPPAPVVPEEQAVDVNTLIGDD
jgi:hypothetical protein